MHGYNIYIYYEWHVYSFSLSLENIIFILPTYRPYVYLSFARETLIQVDVALLIHQYSKQQNGWDTLDS